MEIADRTILATDIRIYLAAVMEAANRTVAPFDFARTLTEFSGTLDKYQKAAGDGFSFAPARAAIASLAQAVARLNTRAASLTGAPVGDPAVRRLNAAVRRLARYLVPVNFTTRPAFFHDHAETVLPLPDLAPALALPKATPYRAGFVRTHLMRGQNRFVAALTDATAAVDSALA